MLSQGKLRPERAGNVLSLATGCSLSALGWSFTPTHGLAAFPGERGRTRRNPGASHNQEAWSAHPGVRRTSPRGGESADVASGRSSPAWAGSRLSSGGGGRMSSLPRRGVRIQFPPLQPPTERERVGQEWGDSMACAKTTRPRDGRSVRSPGSPKVCLRLQRMPFMSQSLICTREQARPVWCHSFGPVE